MARYKLDNLTVLSVDTEGWDAPVLRGARTALRERRVEVLEFEYHRLGLWAREERLQDTVAMLASYGYS